MGLNGLAIAVHKPLVLPASGRRKEVTSRPKVGMSQRRHKVPIVILTNQPAAASRSAA